MTETVGGAIETTIGGIEILGLRFLVIRTMRDDTRYRSTPPGSPSLIHTKEMNAVSIGSVGDAILNAHRMFPVWPSDRRPGCGQTHKPWGSRPVGMRCVRLPLAVSKTYTSSS